jgi:hypothetical protein
MLEITQICCHRGGDIRSWILSIFQSESIPEDAEEILDEEEELIDTLEREMQGYNSENLGVLEFQWMILLKQTYDERLEEVDNKRKTYVNQVSGEPRTFDLSSTSSKKGNRPRSR